MIRFLFYLVVLIACGMPVAAQSNPDDVSFQIRNLDIHQVSSEPTTLRNKRFANVGKNGEIVELATWYDGSFSWSDLQSPHRYRFVCLHNSEKWTTGAVDVCYLSPDGKQAVFCEEDGSLAVLTRTHSGIVGHGMWLPRIRFSSSGSGVAEVPRYCQGLNVASVAWSRDSDEIAILYEDGFLILVDRHSLNSTRIVSKSAWNWTTAQPRSDFLLSPTAAGIAIDDQPLSVAQATPKPVSVVAFCTQNYAVLIEPNGAIINYFEAGKADIRLQGDWVFAGNQNEFITILNQPKTVVLRTIHAMTGQVTGQRTINRDEFAGAYAIPKDACFVETGVRVVFADYPSRQLLFLLDWHRTPGVAKPNAFEGSHLLRAHQFGFKGHFSVLLNSTATHLPTLLTSTLAWPSVAERRIVDWK